MTENKISRKDFLKLAGLASLSVPVTNVVKMIGKDEIVSSPEVYGDFLVRRLAKGDQPYQIDESIYKRFDQKNEMFGRSTWDTDWQKTVNSIDGIQAMADNVPGISREDMAFYQAAWAVATGTGSIGGSIGGYNDGLYNPQAVGAFTRGSAQMPPWQWDEFGYSDEDVTTMIKNAAKFYGATLSGVADLKEEWLYEKYYDIGYYKPGTLFRGDIVQEESENPLYKENGDFVIPSDMKHVVVMAFEMDEEGHNYPLGPAAAATGNGYSRMAFSSACLAEFIRGLGYKAVPAGNSTGLSTPMAIDAGLGENSRMGLLVTPKYGPRVRLAKVITNMPLVADGPISFGVEEFCEVCGKCAEHCPSGAISDGERTWKGTSISNNDGVFKWYNEHEKCLRYWRESGTSCSTCISVCPFNKPDSWLHDATRIMIGAENGSINKLLLSLDDASGFGDLKQTKEEFKDFYLKKENFVHIKD